MQWTFNFIGLRAKKIFAARGEDRYFVKEIFVAEWSVGKISLDVNLGANRRCRRACPCY